MGWESRLTKTPYLVMFVILGAIGVGTASGLVTITLAGDVVITGDMICTDCVDSSDIAQGAVGPNDIALNSITGGNIVDGTIGSVDIGSQQVKQEHIGLGAVTTVRIANGSVTSDKIAPNAIGPDQITINAVNSSEIASNAVGSDEIASNAVGPDEIASNAVDSSEIADNAVGGSEIAGTTKLIFGSCQVTPPDRVSLAGSIETCAESGVSTNDDVVAVTNAGNNCFAVVQADPGTDEIVFVLRNLCPGTQTGELKTISYIVFDS